MNGFTKIGVLFLSILGFSMLSEVSPGWETMTAVLEKVGVAGILTVVVWMLLTQHAKAIADLREAVYDLRDEIRKFCLSVAKAYGDGSPCCGVEFSGELSGENVTSDR